VKHTPLFNTLIVIVCVICLPVQVFTQCEQSYDWTSWNSFTPMLASGTITTGGQQIGVSMTANFSFGSTGNIYGYGAFNNFNGTLPPNAAVPLTTWSFGPGGTTTMCFSTTVTNPVLLLASIGRPGVSVTLQFSRSYVPVFNGQQVTYLNDTTLIGQEGYTIIMFPGNFDCVTIFSTTPEYYTNITWGLNPPLFEVNIEGDTVGCASVTLTASGGQAYAWSGGDNPFSAENTFHDSGTYFLTVTDEEGCTVLTSVSVDILTSVTDTVSQTICAGDSYEGYAVSGTYTDVFTFPSGCDSVRVLTLTVLPAVGTTLSATICSGGSFEGYTASGVYRDTLLSASGCDSVRVLTLTVLPAVETTLSATICSGGSFEGYTASGVYRDTLVSASGCDSVRVLTLLVQGIQITRQNVTLCGDETYNFYGRLITASGVYADTLSTVVAGCDSIISIFVTVVEQPEFLGPDTVLCAETFYTLQSFTDQTFWPDGVVGASYRVNQTGEYRATLRDEHGCVFTDTVYITLGPAVYIPNAFSPNQDGINDCFRAFVAHPEVVTAFRLSVFDRWGNQVFMATDQEDCWDGTRAGEPCSADVYVYYLEISTSGCGQVLKKGDVVLMR
jgi:gliding motility-associated-like protein